MAKIVKAIPPMGHNTANSSKRPQPVYSASGKAAIPKRMMAMPKSMFSILCILILLFFSSLIKVAGDRVVDGNGDEDHPGGVPIIVVHSEIEECEGAEYRICEVTEALLRNGVDN